MGNGPSKEHLTAVSPGNHVGTESSCSTGSSRRRKSIGRKKKKSLKKSDKSSDGDSVGKKFQSKLSSKTLSLRRKKKAQFEDYYIECEKLGSGTFATVKRCKLLNKHNTFDDDNDDHQRRRHDDANLVGDYKSNAAQNCISNQDEFACKIIEKKQLSGREMIGLKDEIRIMQMVQHERVIRLFNVFDDGNHVRLIMELCIGGDLFDLILNSEASMMRKVQLSDGDKSESKHISEHYSALICFEISRALDYLHRCGVCHRDLKPENVLFTLALTSLINDHDWVSQQQQQKRGDQSSSKKKGMVNNDDNGDMVVSDEHPITEKVEVLSDAVLVGRLTTTTMEESSGIITAEIKDDSINGGNTSHTPSSMSAILKQQQTASLSRMTRLKSPGFDRSKHQKSNESGSGSGTLSTTYTTSTEVSPTPECIKNCIQETPLFKPVMSTADGGVDSSSSTTKVKIKEEDQKKPTKPTDQTPVPKSVMYRLISSLKISDFGLAHYLKTGNDLKSLSNTGDCTSEATTIATSATMSCDFSMASNAGQRWTKSMAICSSSASPTPSMIQTTGVQLSSALAGSSSSSPQSPRSPRSPSVTDNELDDTSGNAAMLIGSGITQHLMHTCCGTPHYVAPEVLSNEEYTNMVDYWSLGVMLYIMLCGYQPFNSHSIHAMYAMIIRGDYSFPKPYWTGVSRGARRCVRRLMHVNPKKRYNHQRLMRDEWIKLHLDLRCDCFGSKKNNLNNLKTDSVEFENVLSDKNDDTGMMMPVVIEEERTQDVSTRITEMKEPVICKATQVNRKKKRRDDDVGESSNVLSMNAMNDENLILLGH